MIKVLPDRPDLGLDAHLEHVRDTNIRRVEALHHPPRDIGTRDLGRDCQVAQKVNVGTPYRHGSEDIGTLGRQFWRGGRRRVGRGRECGGLGYRRDVGQDPSERRGVGGAGAGRGGRYIRRTSAQE